LFLISGKTSGKLPENLPAPPCPCPKTKRI
jgi:hypothetical protein